VRRVAIRHRTGELAIGEASVVVAVSAPHRAEAFEACRHGIERLKRDVPIWKKEALVGGEARWVMGS
jgi:molybdopterin synthase catalytic subunit